MFAGRYPHAEAGRAVSPLFAVIGGIGGLIAALVIPHAPPPVLNVLLWAAVAGMTSFLVYSSEGPRERPGSLVQSAVADGVVTGIIVSVSASLLDLIVAAGAGSTGGTPVTGGSFFVTVLAAAGAGIVAGVLAGFVSVPVAGRERLLRTPTFRARKRRPRKNKSRR